MTNDEKQQADVVFLLVSPTDASATSTTLNKEFAPEVCQMCRDRFVNKNYLFTVSYSLCEMGSEYVHLQYLYIIYKLWFARKEKYKYASIFYIFFYYT